MRIAMVSPYDQSRPGGVQRQVVGLASALRTRGHQVAVLHPGPAGTDLLSYASRSRSLPHNGSRSPVSLSYLASRRLSRLLRTSGYDVVHHHEPLAPTAAFGLNFGADNLPRVASFYAYLDGPGLAFQRRAARQLAHRWAAVTAVADVLGGRLSSLTRRPVRVIPACTEFASRAIKPRPLAERPNRVLFIGRDERRKGLDVLLEAYPRLRNLPGPPVELHLIGPMRPRRRRQAAKVGAVVHGEVPDEVLVETLASAKVLCAPSLFGESAGVVMVEAMSVGTPVVASDIPGYRETVKRFGHGHLAPPGSAAALATALRAVLVDDTGAGPDPAKVRWLASFDRAALAFEEEYATALDQ